MPVFNCHFNNDFSALIRNLINSGKLHLWCMESRKTFLIFFCYTLTAQQITKVSQKRNGRVSQNMETKDGKRLIILKFTFRLIRKGDQITKNVQKPICKCL